jgi:alpha-L-rhamnosidase
LKVEDGIFNTDNKLWEWKAATEQWQPAFRFSQTLSGVPLHLLQAPQVKLEPVVKEKEGELFDFGRVIFGYINISSDSKPEIFVGESTYEALDTSNTVLEQSLEMVQTGDDIWTTKSPLAFRYVLADTRKIEDIHVDAFFYPVSYKGAFASSDSMLTRIWMNSAYTLRLCMHDFVMDGVKRDRLPWAGDLAMSIMANAYSFGDSEIIRRSLIALGRAGINETDINGIIDYSLWWVISQDLYQLYYSDFAHLKIEWMRIEETMSHLLSRCDTLGFLKPQNTWLFIDWVDHEKWTALQMLWIWAQKSMVKLAERMNDKETAIFWQKNSVDLIKNINEIAWNKEQEFWLGNPDFPERMSRHSNFLAVISGIAQKDQYGGIERVLQDQEINPVGTPYMAGFENMAMSRLGNTQYMIDKTKDYWGGMLAQGATTFWEAFNINQMGKNHYSFYKRPYGKSLCHAWSAGPSAFLSSEIAGLIPLEDGWKRFIVNPDIGDLEWVNITVPTPYGSIIMDIDVNDMSLFVPPGTTAEYNGIEIYGPKMITLPRIVIRE